MAEEGATLPELRGLDGRLESLSVKYSRHAPQIDSRAFCADFCKLVEGFCGVQGGPAPQLRVLEVALCYFFRASSFLPPHCDHVQHALSSLALSVFELLLFLDQKEFIQEALPPLSLTLQECHLALARHPNVYLLRLKALLQEGGPWGNRVLQAVLREAEVPQSQVDRFLSSEPPLFLELRVRYLLASGRGQEAAALARRCAAARPATRQRAFFLQVHLASLCTTERTEQLHREVCALGGAEVVQVVCGMEQLEEEPVLHLCRAGLRSQLLSGGHAPFLRQLLCVWAALHRRLQTSGPELLEESRQLLQEANNATAIFPFIRVLLEELGDGGLPFCVELCSRALGSGLLPDGAARSLVHKAVAGLLPRDLEVCRACALLVFFQDRSLAAYRTAVRLYSLPDQEYHAEATPVGNHVRFDLLQALKKDLVFDPEFWNIAAIRSNCQKLLSGEEQRAAREEEAPEEAHCTKEASVCPMAPPPPKATGPHRSDSRKRLENGTAPKRTRLCRGPAPPPGHGSLKNKTKHTPRTAPPPRTATPPRESGEFLRRSCWQPGRTNDGFPSGPGEPRRITRFSEKNCPKRRIRTPRWLLEDSGTLEMDAHRKGKKLRRKRRQQQEEEEQEEQARALVKRSASAPPRTDTKEKGDPAEKQSLTRHLKGLSLDYLRPASPARAVLELSLPDNELADIFTEESRRNGLPPALLYQASPRLPGPPPADRPPRLKHVVIRASDEVSLARQLHCYSRRNKHLAAVAREVKSAPSVVTRSSTQAPPTKSRPRVPRSKPLVEMKVTIASHAPVRTRAGQSQLGDRGHAKALSAGSRPADNKASPVAQPPPAPGCTAVKTARRPSPDADTKPLLENLAHEVGPSNARKDLAALQPGDLSESALTDATADSPAAEAQHDAGRHGGDAAACRASDARGRRGEEDLHGLRLLSETVSALAPQSIPEASGEATEERSLPAQQSPTLGSGPDSPSDRSACSPSAPDSGEERARGAGAGRRPAQPGSGEPRLEHRCTLCDKVFRGKRVAVHAMFHCRRHQCMFCRTPLKHGHLATLHVSEHIDALKRRREAEREERGGSRRETSEELQSAGPPPAAGGQRRPRTPLTSPASAVRSPSGSRRLRSDGSVPKGSSTPSPAAKVNGHLKGPAPHQQGPPLPVLEDKPVTTDPPPSEPPRPSKQTAGRLEAGSAVATETSCPVAGCPWRAALSRSSVALLYHALEAHPRDHAPLRLAFSVFDGQCSVCLRVLWSFQHYRHHVERHRLAPRHPCLHQGCGARFRTGMEMRRHSRRHRPLQASCCVPGCSRLFICLWALNLHEREHYTGGGDAKLAEAREAADPGPRRTGARPDPAHATPVRAKGRLKVREPAAEADPHSEVRAGGLGTGRSTLRRSPGSRRVQGVQGPAHCPAGPRSAASHKQRRTPSRRRAEPLQPAPVASGHRMRRSLSGRPVKLNTVSHKTKNPPVPLTESRTTAALRKPARKREAGRFLGEEQQSYHKSHEESPPLTSKEQENSASLDQEESAPLDQEESAPLDQKESAPLDQEQSAPLNQEQSALLDQEQSAPLDQEQSAPLDQEQSAPLDQEQSAPLDQEQSAPLDQKQEQSAPLASVDQEQSAPLDQEQSAPLASVDQEQSAPLASVDQEQSAPLDQEQSAPLSSVDQEQSALLDQEQSAPLSSPDQEQSALLDQEQSALLSSVDQEQSALLSSVDQEQSAPLSSPDQEQSAPLASVDQEQSGPLASADQEQSAPLSSPDQEQSALLDQEQSALLDQEQSAPLASADQEQSGPLSSADQEQSGPLASVDQEQSAPLASADQEQSAPLASVDQEQSGPLASVDQEQSAPLASVDQEQSAPLASADQEQSAPLASADKEQSGPLALADQEQSGPLALADQEQSGPLASADQEQSGPLALADQEQSAPLASVDQEQSAPLASVDQEQSAPLASADQEQSAPLASVDQEQSAPLASADQEQSAPLASADQEQSGPLASADQEQSAPLALAVQEQQASKKHKPISAAPTDSDVDLVKKGRVAHLNSGPKIKTASTGNAPKSKCRTQTKMKDLKVAKATKTASVTKAKKAPSVAKASKSTAVAKATKAHSVAKATKALSVAKATKAPSVAKATKAPSFAKATKAPSVAKATEVTAVAKATEVTAVTKTCEIPQEALATGPFPAGPSQRGVGDGVGYTVLVNGAAAVKRKAADEAPPPGAATTSYRKNYFRAPPTTYLDERFTNMPKRRKHMSMFRSAAPRSPEPRPATRCPSCFSSFLLQEELQAHLGDHRCSSMFGFDSDEDNS